MRIHLVATSGLLLFALGSVAQFTPDRLAVLEYTFTTAFPDPGGPLTIREFATDGTPGVVMNVPSTGPAAVVNNFNALDGAAMTLTPSADKLVFTGFTATAPSGTSLETSSSTSIPRAVGTVDASGNFARPVTTTQFNGARMKAVASDGTGYWAGGGNSGICYLGPGTPAVINSDNASTNSLHFSPAGDLYAAEANAIYRVGSGSPTTPAVQELLMNTNVLFDFQLSPDGTVCYTNSSGMIRKWVWSGTAWTNVYTFNAPGWLVRIVVDFRGPVPVIYGVHNLPTKLVKYVDNGAPVAETILATAGSNVNWYGLSFTPGTTCGVGGPCDDGDPATSGDTVGPDCVCAGQLYDCAGVPGGSAWPGTPCDDGNAVTGSDTWQEGCVCTGQTVRVGVKAILSGALPATGSLMNDQLRVLPAFPLTEPYTALGLPPIGGGTTIASSVLAVAGLNAIVDWVLLELRSAATPSTVLVRRAALLQRDADVVDLDGISPVACPIAAGSYHVVVRHRNHLGVMTASAFALGPTSITVDMRFASTPTHGTEALRNMGTFLAMWSGNAQHDGQVKYTGSGNDRDPILVAVGSTTPNNSQSGQYSLRDVNMNGIVSYTGAGNDRDPILVNVGSTTPNNARSEQLP